MSVKTRLDKINNATKQVIIENNSRGGLKGILVGDYTTYQWSLKRLPKQTVKFNKTEVEAIVYQSDCKCWNEVSGEQVCKGNNHSTTVCYHVLAAFKEAMRLSGFTVYLVDNANYARKLMNFGCKFVKILSSGNGAVTVAIQRKNDTSAFANLKELLEQKRINLTQSGHKMPISLGIELYRRRDGKLAFKQNGRTSKPVAQFSRDFNVMSTAYGGKWQLVPDAERNWKEFSGETLKENVSLMRQPEGYID